MLHRRNFTLKSGGDQWRRQDLVSGGTTIEAPKARASTRQRRRVWSGTGRGVPSPADYGIWGSVVSSPSGVRGKAPAAIAFSACFKPPNASGSKKIRFSCPNSKVQLNNCKFHFEKVVVTVSTTFKSGDDKSPPSHKRLRLCYANIPLFTFLNTPLWQTDGRLTRRWPSHNASAYNNFNCAWLISWSPPRTATSELFNWLLTGKSKPVGARTFLVDILYESRSAAWSYQPLHDELYDIIYVFIHHER